jgi:RNA polymerase sigma-70 factor (ECF subfamily)
VGHVMGKQSGLLERRVGSPLIPEPLVERFGAFLDQRPFDGVHVDDLARAFLSLEGDVATMADLESTLKSMVPVVRTVSRCPAFVEDVLQEVKLRLFVQKQLGRYGGRGPLAGWLRRVVLNAALTMKGVSSRSRRSTLGPEAMPTHPELDFLKARYKDDFSSAFTRALQQLTVRERTLLRLNALGDASIDDLAGVYQVHRATVARWIQSARRRLLETTRQTLVDDLGLDPDESEELVRLLKSQLDISLHRLLEVDTQGSAEVHDTKTAPVRNVASAMD